MTRLFHRYPTLAALGLVLLVAGLYSETLGFGLVSLDDPWLLRDNTLLQSPSTSDLRAVLFDLSAPTRYRLGAEYLPVRDLSVACDFALFGERWGAHHGVNVVLYALACLALFVALGRWLRDRALALTVAALWAVHPLHAESVAWLSERKGLLAALFAFACLAAFQRFCERGGVLRWLLTALTLVLAIWSKGLSLALIGVLALFAWLLAPPQAPRRRAWLGIAALLPVGLLAFWPLWIAGSRLAMVGEQHGGGVGAAAAMMLQVHARYLWRALLGGPLGPVYDTPAGLTQPALFAVGALGLLLLAALAAWALWRRRRCALGDQAPEPPASEPPLLALAGVGAGIWLVMLLPVSQLIFPLQNTMADRYLLLPSLGVCLLVGSLIQRIPQALLRSAALAAVLIASALLCLTQTPIWATDSALYTRAVQTHPRHVKSLLALSRLARLRGDHAAAGRWFGRAATVAPLSEPVLVQQALVALRRGDMPGAIEAFRRAAARPRADRARANLALLLARQGRHEEALRHAESAVKVRPLKAHNHFALGRVALYAHKLKRAERALRRADVLLPEQLRTQLALCELEHRQGRKTAARRRLETYLRAHPRARRDPRVLALRAQLR
jgi:Tfp pilus assembly protein PilF